MAGAVPYLTSNALIATIQRKISMPLSQNLFNSTDILAFCNDEMFATMVPDVLEFHEEYFVYTQKISILPLQQRYPIPTRAIGMKLRDVKWQDTNSNLFDMTRVNPEEKSFYQQNIGTSATISKYYIEGNDLVLLPALTISNAVSLIFYYFLRPNQLVPDQRAAIITSFNETITVLNANINPGDTVTIDNIIFTAVSGSPSANQFQIGGSDIITATNLVNAINANGIASASNGSPSTSLVTLTFTTLSASQSVVTSNSTGFIIPQNTQIIGFNQVPQTYQDPNTFVTTSLFTNGSLVDFLQTNPGHKTYAFDVQIPNNGISGNFVSFSLSSVPYNIVVGDYICLANECIIPQIPPDLHNQLAQRASTMILASIGDVQGAGVSNQKVQEMEKKQISILDARVEGSALKISPKKSLLRFQGFGARRRRL
jgi:hypothetical protein